jgi:hypothetical protein
MRALVAVIATFAPPATKARAMAKPIPPGAPAPVTNATRPATPAIVLTLSRLSKADISQKCKEVGKLELKAD